MSKLGLIGVGRWGINHFRTACELGVLDVVCDRDEAALSAARDAAVSKGFSEIRTVMDVEEIFQDAEIGRVVVATPAPTHYDVVRRALLAGKDVLVEKPLAIRVDAGEELVQLAKARGRILMVGHILLYDAVVQRMLDLVRSEVIGEIWHLKSNRLNFGVIRSEESVQWSFAVHDVSICIAIMANRLPNEVQCQSSSVMGNVDDFAALSLRFQDGVEAFINVSWIHPYKHREVIIVGSKGFIVYDAAKPLGEQLRIIHTEMNIKNRRPANARITQTTQVTDGMDTTTPLAAEYREFLNCCRTRQSPRTDGEEALRVLRVLHAADQSSSTRRAVPLGQTDPPRPSGVVAKTAATSPCTSPPLRPYFAHETAVIDDGAEIGKGTKIWHFSHVMSGASLGEGCNLGQNVFVAGSVALGRNVKVQNNVSLYDGVVCGEDVFIGPSVVFTNVKNPRSAVVRKSEYRRTVVERGASIGANATIVCGVTLGRSCFVGAGAVVTKDVAPFRVVYGNPAREEGWISEEGHALKQREENKSGCSPLILEDGITGRSYTVDASGHLQAMK